MMIKIMQDNSIFDASNKEIINSTHADKAQNTLVQALAEALPFKGAMKFDPDAPDVVLNSADGSFHAGNRAISPDDDAADETPEVQAALDVFYGLNRDSEYAIKWEAKQLEVEVSPEPTPEELKAIKRAKIEQAYNNRIDVLVAGYPEKVRETWPSQESEARAWLLDDTSPSPTLDGIVERSGRDKAALVNSIIEKADYLKYESGKALGDMQAALAALG